MLNEVKQTKLNSVETEDFDFKGDDEVTKNSRFLSLNGLGFEYFEKIN